MPAVFSPAHGRRSARTREADEWKGETVTENNISKATRVKGKNVHGQVVVLTRSKPEQLGLFQTFVPEDEEKYSNTIELYDAVPKYFSHTRGMAALRESGKYLPILDREFEHRGEVYKVQIHPARIRYKDKQEKEFYPSQREELVEEALRKIACDHLNGIYLDDQAAAVPGEPLSDVISICYILGFRKDNTKFFNKLSLNRRHF